MRVFAIDIGTSSARAALFDERGRARNRFAEHYAVSYGADGAAELSPAGLLRAVKSCLANSLGKNRVDLIAGSAFWHGLLGVDGRSRAVTPVYTWADSRAADDARRLRQEFSERKVHARTGCMLRATFWPAKLRWLRRTEPVLFRRIKKWVSPSDWIFSRLFGIDCTSQSMASGTGLFDLATRTWDIELCRACSIDPDRLSTIDVGQSSTRRQQSLVCAAIGDGATSNLGSGADRSGFVAINVGTSAAVRAISDVQAPFGLFRYVVDPDRWLIGGAVSNAGNLREWCLRVLRIDEGEVERALREREKSATNPLIVSPAWVQERAPDWPDHSGGLIHGPTQSTNAADIVRATATAVFYRLAEILELMETVTDRARRIIVSGGILQSKSALQLLADSLGRNIFVAPEQEASLRGAAIYGFGQLGVTLPRKSIRTIVRADKKLARLHRQRRERQRQLEQLLRDQP